MSRHPTRIADLAVGDALPRLSIPLTASAIVAGAIATGDFETVHHDKAAAEASGVPDIFMNILTTNGMVQRFVGAWCPAARIAAVEIKLGAPNFAGDTMTLTGEVAAIDGARAEIAVTGANTIGQHVAATVTLDFGDAR